MEGLFYTSAVSQDCSKNQLGPKPLMFLTTLSNCDVHKAVHLLLCQEELIVKEMHKYLNHQAMLNIRRKELLYRKWSINVCNPLQQKINEKISPSHMILKRRLEEFENFLKYSNKKGNVFSNHYDPEEYDPFYMRNNNPEYLKVTLPPFQDPLFRTQQNRDEEKRTILQCQTGKLYTMKKFKEVEKAKQLARLSPFSFTLQSRRAPLKQTERERRQKSSCGPPKGSFDLDIVGLPYC